MDIQNFAWATTGQNKPCPQIKISFTLNDSSTGAILEDHREGAGKQIYFPDCVSLMTPAEKQQLANDITQTVLNLYVARREAQAG